MLKEVFANLTAYQRVRLARHPLRPHPIDYVKRVFTDFIELHGDRRFGDDPAIATGLGHARRAPRAWSSPCARARRRARRSR